LEIELLDFLAAAVLQEPAHAGTFQKVQNRNAIEGLMLGVAKLSNEAGDMALIERPEPKVGPGQVLIEVASAGICGTDLHIFKGEYKVVPPVTGGHEVCGFVCDTGAGVDPTLKGRRVVTETFFSACGVCTHCRNGRRNLCKERKSIGTHVNGGFAPLLLVPALGLHAVPEGFSSAAATLAEPLACVANSLFGGTPYIGAGDEVVVIGPGAIGLLAAQVARLCGATVTLRGTKADAERLAMAEALGLAVSVAGDEPIESERYDGIVECSGHPNGVADALIGLRKGGRLLQMGLIGKPATIDFDLICFKELLVISGFASTPRSWVRALRMMQSGAIELEKLISGSAGLLQWRSMFDASFDRKGVKFVLDPRL
jgi:L-iditol 2-dehydrogenase